jgi:hypothetical protein
MRVVNPRQNEKCSLFYAGCCNLKARLNAFRKSVGVSQIETYVIYSIGKISQTFFMKVPLLIPSLHKELSGNIPLLQRRHLQCCNRDTVAFLTTSLH